MPVDPEGRCPNQTALPMSQSQFATQASNPLNKKVAWHDKLSRPSSRDMGFFRIGENDIVVVVVIDDDNAGRVVLVVL